MRRICRYSKLNTSIKELRQPSWSWRSGKNWEETGIETKRTFWTMEVGPASNHSWDHSRQTSYMGKKFRNCPVKTSISKWWECTAINYSRFNRGNDHFITLLSYSKQNTMGPGSQFEKLQSSFWFRPWRTNTKVLLGNIITEFYFQLSDGTKHKRYK